LESNVTVITTLTIIIVVRNICDDFLVIAVLWYKKLVKPRFLVGALWAVLAKSLHTITIMAKSKKASR